MTTVMLQYSYVKPRYQFGRQCLFECVNGIAKEDVLPDPRLMNNYILRSHSHRYAQNSEQFAVHEVQTERKTTTETGIFHSEGGWPREIRYDDNEATHRYRRRIERNDNWVSSMRHLIPIMEHYILQNGTLNIHENFFDDLIPTRLTKPYKIRTRNSYADPEDIGRPIRQLSWSPNDSNRLAGAYSFMEFEEHPIEVAPYSYVWDIENPTKALSALKSPYPSLSVQFNPRDHAVLIGGLTSGQVCCWDIRTSDTPQQISRPFHSHRHPVLQTAWIPSKANTEFFSSSMDGVVLWWDTRFLQKPNERLVMDLDDPIRADITRSVGVTVLQYEQTLSSRFLAGMENGMVVSVNRRGATRTEKLMTRFKCYKGPIIAIDRNPAFTKNFLTIGNSSAKVWAEDTKEGCFFSTCTEKVDLTGGCWSRSRCSVFFTINTDGLLNAYDMLTGIGAPLTSTHVTKNKLTSISAHENGELIAVGDHRGDIYLLQCSEEFTAFSKEDKARLSNHLETYGRYEKALDNRMKEIRLLHGGEIAESTRVKKSKPRIKGKESKTKKEEMPARALSVKQKTVKMKTKISSKINEPMLLQAEEMYFRKVEEESAKFEEIDKEDMEAAMPLLKQRVVTQQTQESDKSSEKEDTKKVRRSVRRQRSRIRTQRFRRKTTKEVKREEIEDIDSEFEKTPKDKKKRSRKFLEKICKEVCKPEICCADEEEKLRIKRLEEARKYKIITRLPEKTRSSLIENKLFRKLTLQLDEFPELSPAKKRRMMILKDLPPRLLRKELQLAKEEVRVWQETVLAGKLSSWIVEQKLLEKTKKIEPVEEEKEPDTVSEKSRSKQLVRLTRSSKASLHSRRSRGRRKEIEELQRQEELRRRKEMWERAMRKAKKFDEADLPPESYPRISAAFLKSSEEDIRKMPKL